LEKGLVVLSGRQRSVKSASSALRGKEGEKERQEPEIQNPWQRKKNFSCFLKSRKQYELHYNQKSYNQK